jgi:hypothetical protein
MNQLDLFGDTKTLYVFQLQNKSADETFSCQADAIWKSVQPDIDVSKPGLNCMG